MSLDLSSDWAIIDDTQTVTYLSKTGEGIYAAAVTVQNAYWEEATAEDYRKQPSLLMQTTRAVHLWTAKLGGTVPKLSDKISDAASVNWYVSRVEALDLDATGVQRYRLVCYQGV